MYIIPFAWTTKKLLEGKKTVTRRRWKWLHTKPGDLVQAYDRGQRFKGKCVAIIRILNVRQEKLREITDADEIKEGHLWGDASGFIDSWIQGYPDSTANDLVWRIEFEIVERK